MSNVTPLFKRARDERERTMTELSLRDDAQGDVPRRPIDESAFEPVGLGVREWLSTFAVVAVLFFLLWLLNFVVAWGKDNGQFSASPLKPWFNQLHSGKGLCCAFAEGVHVDDVDWDTQADSDGNQHYRVRLNKEWVPVPDVAVVTDPNRYGPAVVWPMTDEAGDYQRDENGAIRIRCFMPGAGT